MSKRRAYNKQAFKQYLADVMADIAMLAGDIDDQGIHPTTIAESLCINLKHVAELAHSYKQQFPNVAAMPSVFDIVRQMGEYDPPEDKPPGIGV